MTPADDAAGIAPRPARTTTRPPRRFVTSFGPIRARLCGAEGSTCMEYVVAYIDPGSGSLIIQAVVATVVAVPFFIR